MDEPQTAEKPGTGQSGPASRRPWHAPQFFVAEFANTLVQGNGQFDGALVGASSS